jgi:nitroimidazol reductase NimA-like FMN-containing flavoprotein (pyridoxamine 5'-phosphate oxidase superfamily)
MSQTHGHGPDFDAEAVTPGGVGVTLSERIRRLVQGEPYAVLSTQGDGQPYASVVAFAMTDDFRNAVFSTPMATRKYRLLTGCDRVALLIDNRCAHLDRMMEVEAVTATGRAVQVAPGEAFDRWSRLLLEKHPHLRGFVASPSVALFRIEIVRFFHVERFQEVREWRPGM